MSINPFTLLCIPIFVLAFKNYHRAVLVYFICRLFLSQFIPFFSAKGLPLLRLSLVIDTFFLIYFLFQSKLSGGYRKFWEGFPLKTPFLFFVSSMFISSCLGCVKFGVFKEASMFWMESVNSYLIVVLFYREIKSLEDLRFLIKGISLVCILACGYGIFEFLNGFENPLILYEQSLNPNLDEVMWTYSEDNRGGRGRVSSIFAHAIGCGATMAIFSVFLLYLKSLRTFMKEVDFKWTFLLAILCALLLVFLSNSRGPLLLLAIMFISLSKQKLMITIFPLLLLGAIILLLATGDTYLNVFLSIFDSSIEDKMGGGSNVSMRLGQLTAAFECWKSGSLLFGSGLSATNYWIAKGVGLLGAESVWFSLLINQGIFGVLVFCYLMYSVAKLYHGNFRKIGLIWVLAWLCCTTATSLPGLNISTWFVVMLMIYKVQGFYSKEI